MKALARAALALAALALAAAGWLWHVNFNDGVDVGPTTAPAPATPAQQARGAYLARVGNCLACHTARGGAPGAGGLALATEFGTVFSSNLTPDPTYGIGQWSAAAFWRALHHGRSRDGRLLAPVFPYTHTTLLTRADSDALLTYFASLPPSNTPTPPHALRWPYGTQAALALWRALYFQPGSYVPDPARDERWNAGAYLVRGVAHCSACHAPRNALGGADWRDLRGGLMKAQGWQAPSLHDPRQAGLADWSAAEVARLLQTGVAERGRASGPMAEVVFHGTQYLSNADADTMAVYLRALPQTAPTPPPAPAAPRSRAAQLGAKLYEQHCAQCHGEQGQGHGLAYPPLAGNRAVTLDSVDNLLQVLLYGGFNAATAGYPRPFGMPPFVLTLSDPELAATLSHIRTAWGNQASEVSAAQVHALRARHVGGAALIHGAACAYTAPTKLAHRHPSGRRRRTGELSMGLNWFTNRVGRAATEPANANRLAPGQAGGDALTPSWQDMVRQLGEEVATSLNTATEQLTRLNRLEPGLVRSLAPVQDAVERARQAGMAAQHVLRLCEDPPPQRREVLNLADVAHAALTARGDWLRLRRINVRKGFSPAPVFADAALLYQLIDEMLLWVGQLGADIAVSVEPAHASGRPRLQVVSQRAPSAAPSAVWRGVRWVLWHQLARTLEAQTELDLKDEHVRISVSLPAATPEQMAHAAEAQVEPSSVSAVISGCRVLIVSGNAQQRAQCLQALAGYGLIIDTAEDTHQAQQLALQRLPDAVVYDASLPMRDVRLLRGQLLENAGTPAAFIEIHDQPGSADFHASTVGNESTGHVSAAALGQALGPALVFELCRVL